MMRPLLHDLRHYLALASSIGLLLGVHQTATAVNDVAGSLITINDNGAWSWFQDERAVVDIAAGKLIVSSVANAGGTNGGTRNGDVDIAALDLQTDGVSRFVLKP